MSLADSLDTAAPVSAPPGADTGDAAGASAGTSTDPHQGESPAGGEGGAGTAGVATAAPAATLPDLLCVRGYTVFGEEYAPGPVTVTDPALRERLLAFRVQFGMHLVPVFVEPETADAADGDAPASAESAAIRADALSADVGAAPAGDAPHAPPRAAGEIPDAAALEQLPFEQVQKLAKKHQVPVKVDNRTQSKAALIAALVALGAPAADA